MSRTDHAEAMKVNRAGSLARQPHLNPMSGMAPASGGNAKKYLGRSVPEKKEEASFDLKIDRICPDPDQPRKTFDPEMISNLAESIRTIGQKVPAIVRWSDESSIYILIDGEQRYRACLEASVDSMRCVEMTGNDPSDLLEMQLILNALRSDVSPLEQAHCYQKLIEARGYTHRDLAAKLKIAHTTVTRALGLLKLSPTLQAKVNEGAIGTRSAYEIGTIEDHAVQEEVAAQVVSEGLDKEETSKVVNEAKAKAQETPKEDKSKGKGRGVGVKSKAKAKGPVKEKEFKRSGITILAKHSRKLDMLALIEALEFFAWKVKEEIGCGSPRQDSQSGSDGTTQLDPRQIEWGRINRKSLPEAEVAEMREAIESGGEVIVPNVAYDGQTHWLIDGGATVAAALDIKPWVRTIPVFSRMAGKDDVERLAARFKGAKTAGSSVNADA